MKRDSDKQSRLARRKRELDYAIKHELGEKVITRRVNKVRDAALTMLKKYRPAFFDYNESDEVRDWVALEERWQSASTEEILAKVALWREKPAVSELHFT